MSATSKNARVAGFLYLLLGLAGPIRLIYIPSVLFVHDNASATAANIAGHESLFRFGIISDLFCGVIMIFVVLALYRLFEGVDRAQGVLMVVLGGILPPAISFFNVLNDAAALMLSRGDAFLSVFDEPQRQALALLFLRLHHQETLAAEIFWGLWLLPLAILVLRSGFLPRFLGIWLCINGLAYVLTSFTGLAFPDYEAAVSSVIFPALFGEVVFMLWLLIKGIDEKAAAGRATRPPTQER